MSEKTFDNVKITSSFNVPETRENLVSGETIGQHFGKIAKVIEDLENGEFGGGVSIDDTSTTATNKTWSAKKINSSLPKVNNGKLTIQVNGEDVASFSANQTSASTANIEVPTKTSELTNDSNFVVKNTSIPNVIAIPQNGAILLTWTAISGANKYRIQRQNGTTWNTLTMVDTTSYLNTGLTNGTVYSYRVLASTDGGTAWGSSSEIVSATPLVNMINSGTGAASTTNCPVGCWYGQYS